MINPASWEQRFLSLSRQKSLAETELLGEGPGPSLEVSVADLSRHEEHQHELTLLREEKKGRIHMVYVLVGTSLLASRHIQIYIRITHAVSFPGKDIQGIPG